MPVVISSMTTDVARPFLYDGKDYGVGWRTDAWITAEEITLPTTCEMVRP